MPGFRKMGADDVASGAVGRLINCAHGTPVDIGWSKKPSIQREQGRRYFGSRVKTAARTTEGEKGTRVPTVSLGLRWRG